MNEQKTSLIEKSDSGGLLEIEEIFYTIQGEGPLSGHPAVFIRLAGCNLCCNLCDTFYSHHNVMSVENVVDTARQLQHKTLCVITGGEPFRQWNMPLLVRRLLQHFEVVQIETSGSCYQHTFDHVKAIHKDRVIVVCSPKTPKLHPQILESIDAYKYVIRTNHVDDDGLPNEEPQHFRQVALAKPHKKDIPVYLSPWDEKDEVLNKSNMNLAAMLCLQHGYFLSLQTHKIVNLP